MTSHVQLSQLCDIENIQLKVIAVSYAPRKQQHNSTEATAKAAAIVCQHQRCQQQEEESEQQINENKQTNNQANKNKKQKQKHHQQQTWRCGSCAVFVQCHDAVATNACPFVSRHTPHDPNAVPLPNEIVDDLSTLLVLAVNANPAITLTDPQRWKH